MSKKAMSEIGPPQNFIYPLEKILNCAGVVPGDDVFTHERDMCARRKTAQIIQQIGVGLKCAQVVMNAAIIMMHRLLIYWPSHKLPLGKVAAACFFLAAKMEDCPRRLAYVVQQYFRHERQVADIKQVSDEEMSQVGEEIVLLESLILPCLGFNLTITHPHNMLSRGCRALNLPRPLIQTAYYNCTNLLHLTMMVLRLRPETLAAACVQMAASWSNTDLPSVTETDGKYWFNYFDPSMTPELLKAAVDECIAELTKVPPEEKKTVKLLTKVS
uniref:Cyclin N-terminal domain-containing protein n=1 Tax=Macrostomum lignano TaxID=282301 RepID=A0A1I8HY51_9PLAT